VAAALFVAVQLKVSVTSLVRRGGKKTPGGARYDRGTLIVVLVTSGLGVGAGAVLAARVPGAAIAPGIPAIQWALFVVAVTAILAGAGLRQWAISTLGRFFTLDVRIAADQQVVTGGPYRWVRHPSYTAILLVLLGAGLVLDNWLALLMFLLLPTLGLIHRIRVEEAVLVENLGEPYRRYASGKRHLLPGIW
jgi:protein-S-isoprenylcysteine O-methyltransferase Ste14